MTVTGLNWRNPQKVFLRTIQMAQRRPLSGVEKWSKLRKKSKSYRKLRKKAGSAKEA